MPSPLKNKEFRNTVFSWCAIDPAGLIQLYEFKPVFVDPPGWWRRTMPYSKELTWGQVGYRTDLKRIICANPQKFVRRWDGESVYELTKWYESLISQLSS